MLSYRTNSFYIFFNTFIVLTVPNLYIFLSSSMGLQNLMLYELI